MQSSAPRQQGPGTFIVLEGGEGSGKSTQLQLLAERFRETGRDVVTTREPGGSRLAEDIRGLILQDSSADMAPRCEALLFAAARADHAETLIRPALSRGAVVLSDRFVESSIAYQGAARGLGQSDIAEISRWATDGLSVDLTVLLDIDPQAGLARAQDPNRLEAESLAFHQSVREALLTLAAEEPARHTVVQADLGTPQEVADTIWAAVLDSGSFDPGSDGPGPEGSPIADSGGRS